MVQENAFCTIVY